MKLQNWSYFERGAVSVSINNSARLFVSVITLKVDAHCVYSMNLFLIFSSFAISNHQIWESKNKSYVNGGQFISNLFPIYFLFYSILFTFSIDTHTIEGYWGKGHLTFHCRNAIEVKGVKPRHNRINSLLSNLFIFFIFESKKKINWKHISHLLVRSRRRKVTIEWGLLMTTEK